MSVMVLEREANNTSPTMHEPPAPPSPENTATVRGSGAAAGPNYDQMWEAVFEHAPLGMAVFDQEGRVLRGNAALADMLASTPARLAGRMLADITHPDDRVRAMEAGQRLFRGETKWITIHHRCVRDDAQVLWAECACRIFWGPNGEFQSGLAI